jgi:hypothetical protein
MLGIPDCPGLKRRPRTVWTDAARRRHDLTRARLLTIKEVSTAPVMAELGFTSADELYEMIRTRRLYPVFWKNARVVRVFECALPDFRARVFSARSR